jgi:hypothetical protein
MWSAASSRLEPSRSGTEGRHPLLLFGPRPRLKRIRSAKTHNAITKQWRSEVTAVASHRRCAAVDAGVGVCGGRPAELVYVSPFLKHLAVDQKRGPSPSKMPTMSLLSLVPKTTPHHTTTNHVCSSVVPRAPEGDLTLRCRAFTFFSGCAARSDDWSVPAGLVQWNQHASPVAAPPAAE